MKKIIQYVSILMVALATLNAKQAQSQVLGNEWINYSQSYFKIKIGKNGIYQIPQSLLQSNGMGSVSGTQFALYREGQQVPIYVSSNAALTASDYIEFYGSKANGKMDTELYVPVSRQASDVTNIISDSAVYFLTYSTSGATNARLSLHSNIMPAVPPTAEPYCVTTVSPNADNRASLSNGESYYTSTYYPNVYHSGKFDKGEGLSYAAGTDVQLQVNIPEAHSMSNPELISSLFHYSKLSSALAFSINNNPVFDTLTPAFEIVTKNVPFNQSFLQSTSTVRVASVGGTRLNIFKAHIRYNRTFNFSNVDVLNFAIDGNNQTQLLALNNTNNANDNIVVDFVSNNLYHLGSNLNVVLDPAGVRRDLFFAENASIISSIIPVTFKDYTQAVNQGSYLILADDAFINISGGGIDQYKAYRSSVDGGGFNTVVVSANDLYNQFGWGYDYHPLGIKRFLKYAATTPAWVSKPEYMFIIGKGIAYEYINYYQNNRATLTFPIVPTFGTPGSDNLFAEIGTTSVPSIAIGRLSVLVNQEIEGYLTKVKAYELAQKVPAYPNLENSLWKKTALHVAGSTDAANQTTFYNSLNACKSILEDTLIGGFVHTTSTGTASITENVSARIDSITAAGLQYITYYGHASSSGFDYNLNNPENINAKPKFPIFLAFGCDVAKIFEPTNNKTISERYLSEPQGGAVAMVASTNLGWIGFLEYYMQGLYGKMAHADYGKTFGKQYLSNIARMVTFSSGAFTETHVQNFILQGDPGLSVFSPDKPDYFIDSTLVSASPIDLNTSLDSFKIKAKVYNLGKSVKNLMSVVLTKRKDGNSTVLYSDTVKLAVLNSKDITFSVPIDKINDNGIFNYTISLNPSQVPGELSYANNQTSLSLYIGANALVPTYPFEFSIVNQQNIELKATTLSPFGTLTNFVMEVDTTEYFNSPIKSTQNVTTLGGVVKWTMPITMTDSTVYYWRTAVDTTVLGKKYWSTSSFIYLSNSSKGWNQSHFFQYKKDSFSLLKTEEPDRLFNGVSYFKSLSMQSRIHGYGGENTIMLNNVQQGFGTCVPQYLNAQAIMFIVIDNVTGQAMQNNNQFYPASVAVCDWVNRRQQFEFLVTDSASRHRIMDFLNAVPDHYYIVMKSSNYNTTSNLASPQDWANDQLYWGAGNSLTHTLQNLGFTTITSITGNRPYAGVTQKGNPSFNASLIVGISDNDLVNLQRDLAFKSPSGELKSTIIGPATQWQQLQWKTTSELDAYPNNDQTAVSVWGLASPNVTGDFLFKTTNIDTALSTISATQYPYLRLKWHAQDNTTLTLPQLKYWRVLHQQLPEAALNPRLAVEYQDTVDVGDPMNFRFAIENLTDVPMDSMKVRFRLVNLDNNTSTIFNPAKFKPMAAFDTAMLGLYNINSTPYVGRNVLYVEANPIDGQQPEQYHPNNLGFIQFFVDDGTLPVQMLSFDVYKRGETALLEWITASEQNNHGFGIEKSLDGTTWEKIGYVNSKAAGGNSSSRLSYDFLDKKIFEGLNYYRLKQTDFDGRYEYSLVRTLRFDNSKNINLHPNPASTFVEISGLNGDESIVIFDAVGRKVRELKVLQSSTIITLDDLSEGTYLVNILGADGQTTASKKVVKLK